MPLHSLHPTRGSPHAQPTTRPSIRQQGSLAEYACSLATRRNADALDLPVEFNAESGQDAGTDCFAKLFNLRCGCTTLVDQKIAVKFRDLRRTNGKAPQPGLVDQLP